MLSTLLWYACCMQHLIYHGVHVTAEDLHVSCAFPALGADHDDGCRVASFSQGAHHRHEIGLEERTVCLHVLLTVCSTLQSWSIR